MAVDNPVQPDDNAAPSLDDSVPDSEVGFAAQNVTKNDIPTSAVQDSKALFVARNPAPQQKSQVTENVSKIISNATVPVRPIDRESTYTPEIHKQSKQITNLASDPSHALQPSPPVKDAAKADEQQGFSANSPTGNSGRISPAGGTDRGSQPSSIDKSEHGGKHDEEGTAVQASNVETKGIQQGKGIPGADTRNGFPDVMASQALGAGAAKNNSSPVFAPNSSAQPHDGATGPSSKPADLDRPEPQPLSTDSAVALHSAKLVAQPGQSELRLGFQAGEFGSVDIRTSMVRSQVTAQISVEHGELRNLIAVELPHLQTRLAEHQLTATNIVLSNHPGGSHASSKHAHQQDSNVHQGVNSRSTESQAIPGLTTSTESQVPSSLLDVHM